MEQQVEQIDLFLYLEELEIQEAAERSMAAKTYKEQVPVPVLLASLWASISRFKTWFLSNLPILFGLIPWVNVYTVSRAYGGGEAGGWYFRKYTCIESRQVWFWNAEALQMKLRKRFSGLEWGVLTSESVGQEVAVLIEHRRAAQEFKPRPTPEESIGKSPRALENIMSSPALKPVEVSGLYRKPWMGMNRRKNTYLTRMTKKTSVITGKEEPCKRCAGSGRTRHKHVKDGICFICQGSGKREKNDS